MGRSKKRCPRGGRESGIGSGPSSTAGLLIPKRPGFVSFGESCNVKANYLKQLSFNGYLYRYNVSVYPKPMSFVVHSEVVRQYFRLYGQSHFAGCRPVYDGKNKIYTIAPFRYRYKRTEIILQDEEDSPGGWQATRSPGRQFRVMIDLDVSLSGGSDSEELCHVFNTILREVSTGSYYPVGRSFNLPRNGESSENCFGFYQSIQCTQMGISLNVDVWYKSFIKPVSVINFVAKLLSRDISDRPFNGTELLQIKKALHGRKVNVTLQGNMHRNYRISGLTSRVTSELLFPVSVSGRTVVQYFREIYGCDIRADLPCLQFVDHQESVYLPMEVCEIADRQQYGEQLNKKQMSCQYPIDRENTILQTVNPHVVKEFGLTFENKLKIVEGRVLPPPMLKFCNDGKEKEFLPKAGKWNMRCKKMVNGGVVNTWTCINFASDVTYTVASSFCDELVVKCLVSGMNFKGDPVLPLAKASPKYVESALRKHHRRVMKILRPQGKEFDLLIVILPDNNGTLYGDIKRICETDIGLVSQCCLAKHVLAKKPQYLASIALKINVKAGGRNTVLLDAVQWKLPRVSNTPTIIFGADVSHPHPGERRCSPSIAAVVASQDWPEVTKYAGLVWPQAHREEIIQGLFQEDNCKSGCIPGGMIKDHLISFTRVTGHIPGRIIFYRDVVSKGKVNQVLEHELSAIKKACASVHPTYNPQVTIIMVQKRHHTRLFGAGSTLFRSGNILPGTVVDKEICHPTDFDFYLCSHAGTKGVSRPVHYHVLWDENNFTANALQSLTNHLCYTYAKCTSSISIVPPVRYAHLLASRARLYIKPGEGELSFPDIKDDVKKRCMFFC